MQFWFELGSTYSYLAAARLQNLAADAGIAIEWKPFLLGPIFRSQGWNDSPFNLYPAKGRYMWRDMERLCAKYDLPWRRPSQFPRNGLLAARLATLVADQPWVGSFVAAVYRANFAEDRDIAEPAVVVDIVETLGQPAQRLLEEAQAAANKEHLRQQTEEASARGIFGAPTFAVGSEIFWGHDRLEDALAWARRETPRA